MCVVRCLLICLPALFVGLSNGQGCQDEIDPIQCQNFQRSGYCSFGLFIPFMQENCAGTCGFNDCQPDFQCPEISITNGQVEFCTSGRDLDSSCSFTCHKNFGLSSTVDSVCIERNNVGTWSPPVPRCRACGAWEPVRDCSVTCGEGTVLERRECGSESESRTAPCFEEECPADLQCPEISITNGQVEFCTSGRDLGSTCSFNCDEGFGLSSTGDRVCTDRNNRARWVPFPPRCEECEPWQPAGQCSMTCGEGMINEQRQCGSETESRTVSCFKPECPGGNSWDPWSGCSTTCGIGVETRSRSCGTGCTEYDDRECTNAQDCPCACNCVDGPGCGFVLSNPGYYCFFQQFQFGCPASCGLCPACQCGATYGDFGAWTDCTVSCGGGFQYRYRDCNKIAGCPGSHREERRCGGNACPGPAWSEWRNDGSCSEDCDGGIQNQVRDCINGPGCVGQSTRTRPCNMQACPEWGDWINDGDCSKDCGGGIQNQVRDCMNGPGCVGQSTRTRPCNAQACPEWGPWQNQGTCSETCGDGTITQTRTCLTGNDCVGEPSQQVACNEGSCPVDPLGEWSDCSTTCGIGVETRSRSCGTGCKILEHRECIQQRHCPCDCCRDRDSNCVNWRCDFFGSTYRNRCRKTCGNCGGCPCRNNRAVYSDYGPWTDCTVACGGSGVQYRYRDCNRRGGCSGPFFEQQSCGTGSCSGDAEWGPWQNQGTCSEPCGGGMITQTRTCLNGPGCTGENTQEVPCNEGPCPEWDEWKNQGSCSEPCGGGMITQTRTCLTGNDCVGEAMQQVSCNEQPCPEWGPWQNQGTCSETCGDGTITQTRTCLNGPGCAGETTQQVSCNEGPCPVDPLGEWSDCSTTCGIGVETRSRSCGTGCKILEHRECIQQKNCPCDCCRDRDSNCVNWRCDFFGSTYRNRCRKTCGNCGGCPCRNNRAVYGDYGPWTDCTVACGGSGVQYRYRDCNRRGGCSGPFFEQQSCGMGFCPGDEEWGEWRDVGSCSETCGGGNIDQERDCLTGNNCNGDRTRQISCNAQPCPEWDEWKNQGTCSEPCGGGMITQTRTCLNGPGCAGKTTQEVPCNEDPCPEWGEWRNVGSCSETCGGGNIDQERDCLTGNNCNGDRTRQISCNTQPCPEWDEWQNQGTCSEPCGGGMITQTRTCLNGPGCTGETTQEVPCNEDPCPEWDRWQKQGTCSETCGGGMITQTRTCLNGPGCAGKNTQEVSCNEQPCQNSGWSDWTPYSPCDVTCGRGVRVRTRVCQGTCPGGKTEERQEITCTIPTVCPCSCDNGGTTSCEDGAGWCSSLATPASGYCNKPGGALLDFCKLSCRNCGSQGCTCGTWNEWQASACTAACGPGTIMRTRSCPNGLVCDGPDADTVECNNGPCNADGSWSEWGSCSRPCGRGTQTRVRDCSSGSPCQGQQSVQERYCNEEACDNTLSTWTSWSACDQQCGPGEQRKTRSCRGNNCGNVATVLKRGCNQGQCSVSNRWTECSRSCGDGSRMQVDSNGRITNTEDCNNGACPQAECTNPFFMRYKARRTECCESKGGQECGINGLQGRIVGGVRSVERQWPWMVLLNPTPNTICGGNLISNRHVLSAAHCFSGISHSNIIAKFGLISRYDTPNAQRRVSRVHIHPNYDFPFHDIAMLELETPVQFSDTVKPICLPFGETTPDDVICSAAGWGLTQLLGGGDAANDLEEVELRTLPFGVCQRAYSSSLPTGRNPDRGMICAGKISGGVDSCNGDSGGPLMCQRCSQCNWYLAGLTSFGDRRCGIADRPGVYTRISKYESWIASIVPQNEFPEPTSNSYVDSSCT
ncbi:uncharacterized protein LOC143444875 isoform X4 [Clavelina lepadiformis]|uniref:uncharacterized protein LOC143444875 isoform X4 n=1 Tax=Clavelina lepadiformis TaxID=159417 RepID=UPI004042CF09